MRTFLLALAAMVTGAGLVACGYKLHTEPARLVTRTVTVTRTSPPKIITKWTTETRTVTEPPSIPCQVTGGSPVPGVLTPGLPGDTTCSMTLLSQMGADHLAQIQLTAPDGSASIWNLANPAGG